MFYISSSVLKQYILHSTGLVTFQNKRLIATIRHLVQIVFHYLRHSSRGSGIKRVISAFSFPPAHFPKPLHFLSHKNVIWFYKSLFIAISFGAKFPSHYLARRLPPVPPPPVFPPSFAAASKNGDDVHSDSEFTLEVAHFVFTWSHVFSFFLGSCVNFNVSQS